MNDKAEILKEVGLALSANQTEIAAAILNEHYPFVSLANAGRRDSIGQMLAVFVRDGFIERYSGTRLVYTPALRLISSRLSNEFPFHRNWRTDACHFAFWELAPTVDHILPVSRGGADNEGNRVTTSMVHNSSKGNFTLEELAGRCIPAAGSRNGMDYSAGS